MCFPMMVVSYNYRGLAIPMKKSSLKKLVESLNLDIVFLQETMGDYITIKAALESLSVGWSFVAVDARGRPGRLATGWKVRSCRAENVWGFGLSLGVDLFYEDLGKSLSLINFYGPYQDKVPFWEGLLRRSFMAIESLILGGDLNFYLGVAEC